ncbi:MAG: hypothetical protein WCC21_01820 [Candidatus Acidiferrales bacterium]
MKSVGYDLFKNPYETFDHDNAEQARNAFLESAAGVAYAGDLNDDGIDEILMVPDNGTCRTIGCNLLPFGKEKGIWVPLAGAAGSIARAPSDGLDTLPTMRHGYHDIRILDDCFKWNGRRYASCDDSDYRRLSPEWFDRSELWSAAILWRIECGGHRTIQFIPRWVSGMTEGSSNAELDDNIQWMATFRGGVYGISGTKSSLLLHTPGHLGAEKLDFQGDLLLIYTQSADDAVAVASYNRRSKELKFCNHNQVVTRPVATDSRTKRKQFSKFETVRNLQFEWSRTAIYKAFSRI